MFAAEDINLNPSLNLGLVAQGPDHVEALGTSENHRGMIEQPSTLVGPPTNVWVPINDSKDPYHRLFELRLTRFFFRFGGSVHPIRDPIRRLRPAAALRSVLAGVPSSTSYCANRASILWSILARIAS
jgi:hypothetical protein